MMKNSETYQARRGTLETLETSQDLRKESSAENIERGETLGQLIRRRMYDLRIASVAELAQAEEDGAVRAYPA